MSRWRFRFFCLIKDIKRLSNRNIMLIYIHKPAIIKKWIKTKNKRIDASRF